MIGPVALTWHRNGFCAVPVRSDGSKAPGLNDWKEFQRRLPNETELRNWWANPDRQGFGLIMGSVSGNAEMLEFEGRAVSRLPEFLAALNGSVKETFVKLWTGYRVDSPTHGKHLVFRVGDGPALGNAKIARRPRTRDELIEYLPAEIERYRSRKAPFAHLFDDLELLEFGHATDEDVLRIGRKHPLVLIETRGEGGFIVSAPSNGTTHPTGGQWVLEYGEYGVVPVITCAERDALYDVLRSFDEMPNQQINVDRPRNAGDSSSDVFSQSTHLSPLDNFNAEANWADILTPHGWVYDHNDDEGTSYWIRPGKATPGFSATTGRSDTGDRLYVFSTSTPFEAETPMSKAFVWAHYNTGGDLKAAAAHLYEQGWGDRRRSQTTDMSSLERPWHLNEEFWEARPIFGHLRQAAWSRMASPEGVLVATICLTLYHTEPNVVLSAPVGSEAPLNLMATLCGSPSDGKSACRKVAQEALDFVDGKALHTFSPSSGQGIAKQYQFLKKPRGQEPYMERVRTSAFAMVEEIDSIKAQSSMRESTLSSELRKASMGEALGAGNVGETATNLPEGSYRFVMLMCTQPRLAGWLLEGASGGLPQRFLWCSVRDQRIIDGIEFPGKYPVRLPFEARPEPSAFEEVGNPRARWVMTGTPAIHEEIREAHRRAKMADDDDINLDGHTLLTRRKVSAALALLDGRNNDCDDDWDLAGQIMDASDASRDWVQSLVMKAAAEENEQKSKARGRGRVIENRTVAQLEQEAEDEVREAVLEILRAEPGRTARDIRKLHRGAAKVDLEALLAKMISDSDIRSEDTGRTTRLFVAEAE